MSKTGRFLSKKEEGENQQDLADIHPFSQVKPRKRKNLLIGILAVFTAVLYGVIGFFVYKDFMGDKQSEPEVKKSAKTYIKPENFSVDISGLEPAVKRAVDSIQIPELSFYKKPEQKVSRYRYYLIKAKESEIKGNYLDAVSFYKKAWSASKKDPDVLYRIALLYYKTKQYRKAEIYAKQLAKIKKNDPKVMLLLAKSYEKTGKTKKAKLILEEAYFLYPENKEILENLGKLYEKENALIVAKDIYQILADMGYIEGKLGLARVYEKLGEKKSALKIYRELYQSPNISEELRSKIEDKIISLE
ncbi:tetratricopeptide repeat protein [Persephonella sp.]